MCIRDRRKTIPSRSPLSRDAMAQLRIAGPVSMRRKPRVNSSDLWGGHSVNRATSGSDA